MFVLFCLFMLCFSLIESSLSIYMIFCVVELFNGSPDMNLGILLMMIFFTGGICWLHCLIRTKGADDATAWFWLELLVSPIAFPRVVIMILVAIFGRKKNEITIGDEWFNDGLFPLQRVTSFVFYFYKYEYTVVTKANNILTQLFLLLPLSALTTYCAWVVIDFFASGGNNDIAPLIPCSGISVLLSYVICSVRGHAVSETYRTGEFKFKNKYTGKVKKFKSEDDLRLTEEAKDAGWETIKDGYISPITTWALFTLIFSPIIFFTQLVALLFSILSLVISPIYSCYGKLDYDKMGLGFMQKVLHFCFSFVIY